MAHPTSSAPPAATIEWQERQDVVIFQVFGYLEEKSGITLLEKTTQFGDLGRRLFIIDFSACPVVNSLGLVQLSDVVLEISERYQGQVYLVGLNELHTRVFQLTGLMKDARTTGTIDQAFEQIHLPG